MCAAVAAAGLVSSSASAQVTAYGDVSPSGNYAAFLSTMNTLGASTTTITFNDQLVGLLNPNFFAGVTLTGSGSNNTIRDGAGPGQGNTDGSLSGEGPHAASPYVFSESPVFGSPSSFTVSFSNGPVTGAGLFILDFFNPTASNEVTLEAFTGTDGSGTSLGLIKAIAGNFQNNNTYFVGFTSGAGDIRSLVLSRLTDQTGDDFGIDDVTFGSAERAVTSTPEPASLTLIATGLLGVAGAVRRKRRTHVSA